MQTFLVRRAFQNTRVGALNDRVVDKFFERRARRF